MVCACAPNNNHSDNVVHTQPYAAYSIVELHIAPGCRFVFLSSSFWVARLSAYFTCLHPIHNFRYSYFSLTLAVCPLFIQWVHRCVCAFTLARYFDWWIADHRFLFFLLFQIRFITFDFFLPSVWPCFRAVVNSARHIRFAKSIIFNRRNDCARMEWA